MSGGARHDEYGIRHAPTRRRRLAAAEAELGEARRQLNVTPWLDRSPNLFLAVRRAEAKVRRLRSMQVVR